MLKKLRAGGLGDAYLVEDEDAGYKISLGLFGEMTGAERIELQAKSMDLPADITPRMREATVFFVDIGLPPGKGASAIHSHTASMGAQVASTRHAIAATPANYVAFTRDNLPWGKIVYIGTHLNNFANKFMAHYHGYRNGLLCPTVPVVDMQIGTTDGCAQHFN